MKQTYALATLLTAAAGIALISTSLGTDIWGNIVIERFNSSDSDGQSRCTRTRTIGLFSGRDASSNILACGNGFEFNSLTTTLVDMNQVLLYFVITLCGFAILFGLMIIIVAGYNLFSRPYESWAGPVGLLSYFCCGFTFTLVAMIIFTVTGFTDLNDTVIETCNGTENFVVCETQDFEQTSFAFGYSFYLLVGALGPFILGIIVVVLAGQTLQKKLKSCLCPGSLEEPEIQEGKDNNIMMF